MRHEHPSGSASAPSSSVTAPQRRSGSAGEVRPPWLRAQDAHDRRPARDLHRPRHRGRGVKAVVREDAEDQPAARQVAEGKRWRCVVMPTARPFQERPASFENWSEKSREHSRARGPPRSPGRSRARWSPRSSPRAGGATERGRVQTSPSPVLLAALRRCAAPFRARRRAPSPRTRTDPRPGPAAAVTPAAAALRGQALTARWPPARPARR